METSTGLYVFLMVACAAAFLVPLLRGNLTAQLRWQPDSTGLSGLMAGLPVMLGFYGLAALFHLQAAEGFFWFIGAYLASGLLACLALSPWLRGVALLLAAFLTLPMSGIFSGGESASLLLVSALFGFLVSRLGRGQTEWEDFTLPAALLIGAVWIAGVFPSPSATVHWNLFLALLAVSLLLRTLGALPLLPEKQVAFRPLFWVVTGALAAWLAVQMLLTNPSLLRWVPLYAGGLLLAFLLPMTEKLGNVEEADTKNAMIPALIQIALIGIAALAASRLFGTLGWLVLAVSLLGNAQTSRILGIATLFFLGRSLLQVFLLAHNPNVTGINITHPYAGAALFAGFIAMLLLPALANRQAEQRPDATTLLRCPFVGALVLVAVALAGGLSNYFLHAEATGSLLVASLTAGFGVSLLSEWRAPNLAALPLPMAMLLTSGAFLFADLITLGNEAEKLQKILVLAAALAIFGFAPVVLKRLAPKRSHPEAA